MKFAVKVLGAACLFAGMAFAQEKEYEVSFSNELSTDTITYAKAEGHEKDSATVFAGIVEKAEAGFESEKLSFSVMGEWTFQPVKTVEDALDDQDVKGNQFTLTDHDWFIEFRPISQFAIGWNDDLFVSGSSLPVWDDDIKAGNYTTNDGLALIARPVEGLSIGVGLDQCSFGLDKPKDKFKPLINFGANYSYQELFAAGVAVQNVAGSSVLDDEGNEEERKLTFGVFASITAVENLTLNLGYTHNDYEGIDFGLVDPFEMFNIVGQNVATLGATYEAAGLSLAVDAAFNFNGADDTDKEGLSQFAEADGNRYDAYFGLCAEYAITEQFTAGVTGLIALDLSSNDDAFEDNADLYFAIGPAVKYAFNDHNEFSLGVNFEKAGSDYQAMNIPLSWKYNF
ncbi:MAG: transporter [Treponema sp.]|nr:transporter [Treponema sp.]